MATYTVSLGGSVGAGTDKQFVLDAVTIGSNETFKRCKIGRMGTSCDSYCRLRGNAQSILGSDGFDTWTTNASAISWSNKKSPKVTVHNTGSTTYSWRIIVTIETTENPKYKINSFRYNTVAVGSSGSVSITPNKSEALAGETITLSTSITGNLEVSNVKVKKKGGSTQVTVTNNKFTMPAYEVEITATVSRGAVPITKEVIPAGAGTVTAPASAYVGGTVNISQTAAAGYVFEFWTITTDNRSTTQTANSFTMPDTSSLRITANYRKISTLSLNKTTLTGGENVTLNITQGEVGYTHKYQLSFGTGMETAVTDVTPGTTSLNILVPASWAEEIPNATTKGSGYLRLWTYEGETALGYIDVTGLTYQVPADAVPSIGEIVTDIARTVGGTNYWRWNIGDYFVQNHSGVEIQAEAEGTYEATIASMTAKVLGQSGQGTANDDEIDWTSGLLTVAGTVTVEVTATDSRGRTSTKQAQITVIPYSSPAGTLKVKRVDVNGDPDDMGQYGWYEITHQLTEIGSNALTISLASQGLSGTPEDDEEFLIPGNKLTYALTNEHTITMTLADAFETVTVVAVMRSAKFIMHVAADGDRLAFFKAVGKTVPAGKTALIEIDTGTQVYFGNKELEEMFVLTDAQNLTDAKKLQAQQNIGLESTEAKDKTTGGFVADARAIKEIWDKLNGLYKSYGAVNLLTQIAADLTSGNFIWFRTTTTTTGRPSAMSYGMGWALRANNNIMVQCSVMGDPDIMFQNSSTDGGSNWKGWKRYNGTAV